VDSSAAVTRSGSIKDFLAEEVYIRPQFGLITVSAFAGIGLALVLIGIFSVMAYTSRCRPMRSEFGWRLALSAATS